MKEEPYIKVYNKGPKTLRKESRSSFVLGLITIIFVTFLVYMGFDKNQIVGIAIVIFIFGGVGLLFVFDGIRKLKKANDIKHSDDDISKAYYKLEQFKNMKISKKEVDNYIGESLAEHFYDNPIILSKEELKEILLKVKYKTLSETMMFEWVDNIWFSDFYIFSDTVSKILNELENMYQDQRKMTERQVSSYINELEYAND